MTTETGAGLPDWYRAALYPRSIAIIGASSNPAKNHYQQQLCAYGFQGRIYPVNPREKEIEGLRSFAGVRDIPSHIDLALIALPAAAVPDAVADCVAAGVSVVYPFAAGFSEAGPAGAGLEHRIVEILASSGGRTRMLGPNGTGIISAANSMVAVPLAARVARLRELHDGGLALASQSGLVASAAFIASQAAEPGIGRAVAIGNEADLGLADVIEGYVDDPSVSVILSYLEGLREPQRFLDAVRSARRRGKPVVVLKGGTTDAGAAAAASHTASMAGSDAVFSGVLAQEGVRRATSVAHMLDVARILRVHPDLRTGRATILTSSGGLGIMLTDLLVGHGFTLAPWGAAERQRLHEVLRSFVSVSNPLDGAGDFAWGRTPLQEAMQCADANEETDFVVVTLGGMPDGEASVARLLPRYQEATKKPLLAVWVGGTGRAVDALNAAGIPTFDDLQRLVLALVTAVGPRASTDPDPVPVDASPTVVAQIQAAVRTARAHAQDSLDEVAAKSLLKAAGFQVADEVVAEDQMAARAASSVVGFPLVMKLRAPGLMHKSDLRAISIGVPDEAGVAREADRLLGIAAGHGLTGADLVLQRQIEEGLELLIGMHRDPVFGPVVSLGLGGVLTEALADVQSFRPDITEDGFRQALAAIRHQRLLTGYRHLPAVDPDALWVVVARFAGLVRQLPDEIREIDVNPLIVGHDGTIIAVDALVVLRSADGPDPDPPTDPEVVH